MSFYGQWLAASIADESSSSAEVNLGGNFDFLQIQIPETVAATIKIQVSETSGGTFYDLGDGITTAAGTHEYADVFKLGGYQFIKVVSSVSQTDEGVSIRVRGWRF